MRHAHACFALLCALAAACAAAGSPAQRLHIDLSGPGWVLSAQGNSSAQLQAVPASLPGGPHRALWDAGVTGAILEDKPNQERDSRTRRSATRSAKISMARKPVCMFQGLCVRIR